MVFEHAVHHTEKTQIHHILENSSKENGKKFYFILPDKTCAKIVPSSLELLTHSSIARIT
jgi:hypothetical protein